MRRKLNARLGWVFAVLLATAATALASGDGKPWSRAYRSELYAIVQVLGGDKVTALHDHGEVTIDTTPVYGAGMGLNINDHVNVNTEIMLGSMDVEEYSPYWMDGPITHDNDSVYLWNLNLDINLLKGRLTPVLTGGVGVLGYNGEDRLHEVHFANNFGAGVRWDVTDRLALRVLYRRTWWEIENGDQPFEFDGVAASLIFMFK